jgi:hypothetical protein
MRIGLGATVAVLLVLPAVGAGADPPARPPTPAERYKALVKEYADAWQALYAARQAAKTDDERRLAEEKLPRAETFAPKFFALAEKYPKDPAAFDALVWVATSTLRSQDSQRAKALELLLRDHLQSERLGGVCGKLSRGGPIVERFLRSVLDKSPHQDVRADACLALARHLNERAELAGVLKRIPNPASAVETMARDFGKDYAEAALKDDPAALEAENEKLARRFADKYLGAIKQERRLSLAQSLWSPHGDRGSELILRRMLDSDPSREVQAQACLSLAYMLKDRVRFTHSTDVREVAKVRAESEKLFTRAADKYGDVKRGGRTVAESAKRALDELHAIAFLSPGKSAPEIEAQDQDGKKFKLSDYRGKVVLLDFWSQF